MRSSSRSMSSGKGSGRERRDRAGRGGIGGLGPGRVSLRFEPLTASRFRDVERLFGERGACGGCWCMYWRLTRADFERRKGADNRRAFQALVRAGRPAGLLAYHRDLPVGWCAVAPRESYPTLERSRILKRIDGEPVWSVTCLFIARPYRRRGVSVGLLRAAAEHVARRGGRVVEGYPVEPRGALMPDVFAWTGTAAAFRAAGFKECARRSETRPIMRRVVGPERAEASSRCS